MAISQENSYGQKAFCLENETVRACLTETAGMLAPVEFQIGEAKAQPYSIAPWWEEEVPSDLPPLLQVLRGDFFCSCFGGNDEAFSGVAFPPHGETANGLWEVTGQKEDDAENCLTLAMDLPLLGGRCVKETLLKKGHPVVYQRHRLSGMEGPVNPGHHATLRFPDRPKAGKLNFSEIACAHTYVHPTERPEEKGYSWLKANSPIQDLTAVPCMDGSVTDVTRYPARRGFEDILIVAAPPEPRPAWVTVTFPEEGYLWFALRDPRLLPSTLLWISNGGRHYAPWNGRHVDVMGVENICGFFHEGLAASARPNFLNDQGVATCHHLKGGETLTIPYIQGVAPLPEDFREVKKVLFSEPDFVKFVSPEGLIASVPCHHGFVMGQA